MNTIKILQWNVLYQEKSENIIKFLKHTKPDIFCGQELTVNGPANTEADILINNELITIGTAHLLYTPFFKITQQRLDEAEKLFEVIQNRHERFILAGDLNATPDSSIIKSLEKMFIHADPNTDRPTWTTKPFSYQGFEANSRDWRLDYIFCTEDINVVTNKILETNYSDHLPILTEIQI
jgi:endonuclease/exonuclease/phosphatase family metal-dependent hydrolase